MKKKDYREYCQLINQIKLSDTSQEELPKLQPLVDWICKNTPKRLFRYRRYDKKNVNAFKKQRIWLSTAKNMNDDFDSALYCDIKKINSELDELFDSNGVLKLDKLLERDDVYSVLLQSYSKEEIENAKCSFANAEREELRNFSLALKAFYKKNFDLYYQHIFELEQDNMRMSCFSEDIFSPLMWGHYAENSTGFALAYDFRAGIFNTNSLKKTTGARKNNPYCLLLPIIYSNQLFDATDYARYIMQIAIDKQFFNLNLFSEETLLKSLKTKICSDYFMKQKILIHKFKDWQYEKEWRMTVAYDSSCGSEIKPYIEKKPCALYLGRKIKTENECELRNIALRQNIPIYKMRIDPTDKKHRLQALLQKGPWQDN